MMGLTPMQAGLLRAIKARCALGYGPSYAELADDVGIASKSGVSRLLRGLRERGHIEFSNRPRSIRAVDTGALRQFSDAALLAEIKRRGLG